MAEPLQLALNNAMSPTMEELIYFHDYAMATSLVIGLSVSITLMVITTTKLYDSALSDANQLEFMWTLLPVLVLVFIATPSMRTLYLLENQESPHLTIKTLGHQWYWSYEYSDLGDKTFDSYMTQELNLENGSPRLLEVDHRMVIPTNSLIRLLVSAEDVLHSWTLPTIGIKTDAIPGRLNQLTFISPRHGVFYGQCSEICGMNHSFMPITMESIPVKHFENWLHTP
uniref:Cytochrome c oxidase subunit 2 n=1 Tax=Pseudocalotes microlepis TaxID=1963763 RepID=A0A384TZS7_9SAUR|nr:cytochrome c oxidase subunit II [Pseudocalotes microlepis]AQU64357.1 cytochrome c oxidase subunit II [Pseudocalotes microlepis]QGN67000.1 cytochrome c oxidase subunit II [Pseudocalotes microlepis]